MRRRLRPASLALGLALGFLGCSPAQPPPDAGELAPLFTLPDLDGRPVSLESFRGQLVVVDFWATWCAPCVFQIPVLNEFYDARREDGVVVLGVSVDVQGPEVVAAFAREHGIRYPVLLGSEALARDYGAPGFPALVVVDAQGRIHSLHLGVVDRADLEQAVEGLRARQAGPA